MPIGSSGRIVIEVDPELKHALHVALRRRGFTLKEWFVRQAEETLSANQRQLEMPISESPADTAESAG